LATGEEGLVV